jgi:hypothetical protein
MAKVSVGAEIPPMGEERGFTPLVDSYHEHGDQTMKVKGVFWSGSGMAKTVAKRF